MPKIILEGGTDVAEMSLFSQDDLPSQEHLDNESAEELEDKKQLIRLPTGADGAFLLHLYTDDPIPTDVLEHCVQDDAIESDFNALSGQIAFGGLESASCNFEPNPAIRSDCSIPAGKYRATAYHTEYPDELYEGLVLEKLGRSGKFLVELPGYIVMGAVLLTIFFLFRVLILSISSPLWVLGTMAGGVLSFIAYGRLPIYKDLELQRSEIERDFPSIVVHLKKLD